MKPLPMILLGTALLLAGAVFLSMRSEGQRRERYAEAIAYGTRMEQNLRFGVAAQTYESALELELTGRERADLRYRLARAKIRGNNPRGALGVLQELLEEDVATYNLELGSLYIEGGDKAMALGQEQLARIFYREGRGVAPARYEEFGRRLDSMLEKVVK